MALLKLIIFIIAITTTTALSITLTMRTITQQEEEPNPAFDSNSQPSKIRKSRFLAENPTKERNPRAADHCRKDNEICYLVEGKNSSCCSNKCVDLAYDDENCGACKKKCKFTQKCCRGECVELAYDKRHCGYCNQRCNIGEYCVYGMCNYA